MKQHQGIWLPDHEQHMIEWMNVSGEMVDGKGTYQIKKLRAALEYVKDFRTAIDVGGHVGFWSMQLAKRFDRIHAFEPVEAHRECFTANIANPFVLMYPFALGAEAGSVDLEAEQGSSGSSHIVRTKGGHTEMRTMDSFGFSNVGFIKIDCEGYEAEVLKGATDTLLRCKPCVIVEQKEKYLKNNFGIVGHPAVELLKSMGAEVRRVMSGDYILTWN